MRRPRPCASRTRSIDGFLPAAWRWLRIGRWSRMDISLAEFLSHHSLANFARSGGDRFLRGDDDAPCADQHSSTAADKI